MCGIAGLHIKPEYKGKIPAGRLLDWLLVGIQPRGTDATGFLSVGFDNQVQLDKAPIKASDFIKKRKSIKAEPQTILAHTRYATQGGPEDNRNNHPVNYATTFLVHNGWITNDYELYEKYDMERHADVDTEAIAALLWDKCAPDSWGNADKALEELEGAMAVAAIDIRRPGELLLARGYSSPLVYVENKQFIMWASTKEALKLAWGKVLGTPPADNKFKSLAEGDIFFIKDGETMIGSFSPSYGTRYTSSAYAYGYATWDDYDNDKKYGEQESFKFGTESSTGGYWETMKDGTRIYRSYTKRLDGIQRAKIETDLVYTTPNSRGTAMGNRTPWTPLTHEYEKVKSYADWAMAELEIHNQVVDALAGKTSLDPEVIEWMLFHIDPAVLDMEKKLQTVRDFLDSQYTAVYDTLMEQFLKDEDEDYEKSILDSPPAANETIMAEILKNATSGLDAETKVKQITTGKGDRDNGIRPFPEFDPLYACLECGSAEMEDSGYCIECEVRKEVRASVG